MEMVGDILIWVGAVLTFILSIYLFYRFIKLLCPESGNVIFLLFILGYILVMGGAMLSGKYSHPWVKQFTMTWYEPMQSGGQGQAVISETISESASPSQS